MATSPVLLLVDDSVMSYMQGSVWQAAASPHFIDGNSSFAGGASNSGPFGSFSYTFQGTSIAFYGNTPPSDQSQTMFIRIDDDTASQSTYPIPQEYRQWYTSPTLSDATHTVVLDDLVWIDLDYTIITAGTSTSLSGTTLIVDDNDPDLVYGGRWTNNRDLFTIGHGQPSGLPFQNATHQSNTIGDSMTFQFAGTSVGVYGLFKWNIPGSIAASFSVDGKSMAQTFSSSSQSPFEDQPNFEFFNATGLQPGNHTLVLNITNVVGAQSLMFDYILYHPSFDSLASKPNFTAASSITSSSPSAPAKSPIVNTSRHKNTAAIVGGVVGGLILLLVLVGVVFLLWSRGRRRTRGTTSGDNGVYSSKIDAFQSRPAVQINTDASVETRAGEYLNTGLTQSSSSVFPSTASATANSRQAYIRAQELSGLTAELERETAMSDGDSDQITALKDRINQLVEENARLNNLPPPAYGDDDGTSVGDQHGGSSPYTRTIYTQTSGSKR